MFADQDNLVTLHTYHAQTREYTGEYKYYWAKGMGIAANSTTTPPPHNVQAKEVAIFEDNTWVIVQDNRGTVVYNTENQQESVVDYVGVIKAGFTTIPPLSQYDTWSIDRWVDERTEEEKYNTYLKSLKSLTRRQFKLALLENSLLTAIDTAISNISDPTLKARIEIEYVEATEFIRTSESVKYMLSVLELTEEEANLMWEAAQVL